MHCFFGSITCSICLSSKLFKMERCLWQNDFLSQRIIQVLEREEGENFILSFFVTRQTKTKEEKRKKVFH